MDEAQDQNAQQASAGSDWEDLSDEQMGDGWDYENDEDGTDDQRGGAPSTGIAKLSRRAMRQKVAAFVGEIQGFTEEDQETAVNALLKSMGSLSPHTSNLSENTQNLKQLEDCEGGLHVARSPRRGRQAGTPAGNGVTWTAAESHSVEPGRCLSRSGRHRARPHPANDRTMVGSGSSSGSAPGAAPALLRGSDAGHDQAALAPLRSHSTRGHPLCRPSAGCARWCRRWVVTPVCLLLAAARVDETRGSLGLQRRCDPQTRCHAAGILASTSEINRSMDLQMMAALRLLAT